MAASLSVAEQQLLAIGRGLMSLPRLLMLNKPSPGLAHILLKLVFEIIEGINRQGVIILFLEQNVNSTFELPTKRIFWKQGVSPCKAEAEGSPRDPTHQKSIFVSVGGRKSFK